MQTCHCHRGKRWITSALGEWSRGKSKTCLQREGVSSKVSEEGGWRSGMARSNCVDQRSWGQGKRSIPESQWFICKVAKWVLASLTLFLLKHRTFSISPYNFIVFDPLKFRGALYVIMLLYNMGQRIAEANIVYSKAGNGAASSKGRTQITPQRNVETFSSL